MLLSALIKTYKSNKLTIFEHETNGFLWCTKTIFQFVDMNIGYFKGGIRLNSCVVIEIMSTQGETRYSLLHIWYWMNIFTYLLEDLRVFSNNFFYFNFQHQNTLFEFLWLRYTFRIRMLPSSVSFLKHKIVSEMRICVI